MKIAPIMREMSARSGAFTQALVHTGQHYDKSMSQVFFDELGIPEPDVNLEVGSGSHAWQVAQIMLRLEPIARELRPDWLVVVGDVNSTFASTFVCERLGVKVAHVEAGLRSRDRSMPEEVNRLLTDQLSHLLFTTSEDAGLNLEREGIDSSRIRFVGNVMIDSLVRALPAARARQPELARELGVEEYALVTLHRPGNVDDSERLAVLMKSLKTLSARIPVVFPLHPRTRQRLLEHGVTETASLRLTAPLGYGDFLALMTGARLVLTDSGGIQEETTYLGVPCLTLRPNTERPVTLSHGTNRLLRPGEDIVAAALDVLAAPAPDVTRRPPLWDGETAPRIVQALAEEP